MRARVCVHERERDTDDYDYGKGNAIQKYYHINLWTVKVSSQSNQQYYFFRFNIDSVVYDYRAVLNFKL